MKSPFDRVKTRKEAYQQEYEAAKEGGESFFPETLARDAIVALVVVAAIVGLAIVFPAELEPPADPTSTTYNPRPEWYFLFFFQFLKFFPGWLEPIAAAVVPLVALIIFALIPFLDRGMERRWSQRKRGIGMGGLFVAVFATLVVMGAMSAPSRPAGEESPLVRHGREVYQEINCAYCHSINNVGGNIGPDLSTVARSLEEEEMATYLQDPHAMVPTTLHPKLLFTDEELAALVAYLSTLGEPVAYSEQAPALFAEHCSSCHMVNGEGGTAGPDLSTVGDRRNIDFLRDFTSDPRAVIPGATMPAFEDDLTAEQIQNIAAYLYSLRSETPAETTPSPEEAAPSAPVTAIPRVPHTLEGRSACLNCHEPGVMEVPRIPDDHEGRTNNVCLSCHSSE